jgi:hypothetical protein
VSVEGGGWTGGSRQGGGATIHRVANAGITIIQHTLDLDSDPAELVGQIDRLAALVAARATPALVPTSL